MFKFEKKTCCILIVDKREYVVDIQLGILFCLCIGIFKTFKVIILLRTSTHWWANILTLFDIFIVLWLYKLLSWFLTVSLIHYLSQKLKYTWNKGFSKTDQNSNKNDETRPLYDLKLETGTFVI